MSENLPQVVALIGRFVTAIIAIISGGLFVRWGVHLYRDGVIGKSGTLRTVWKDRQFVLTNGAPGTFLSIAGVVVMVTALLTMPGYDAGTVKVSERRPPAAEIHQLATGTPRDSMDLTPVARSLLIVLQDTACVAPPGQYRLAGHEHVLVPDSAQRAELAAAAMRCAGAWNDSAQRHQITVGLTARSLCSDSVPCSQTGMWRVITEDGDDSPMVPVQPPKPWWQFWK